LTTRTEYHQDFPFVGAPSTVKETVSSGGNTGVLSQTTTSYGCTDFVNSNNCTVTAGRRYFTYPSTIVSNRWDLNGAAYPTTTITNLYDNWNASDLTQIYGNLINSRTSSSDGYITDTTNTYLNDTGKWVLGLLTRSAVVSTAPDVTGGNVDGYVAPITSTGAAKPPPAPISPAVLTAILNIILD
jgi:hypothetical protein